MLAESVEAMACAKSPRRGDASLRRDASLRSGRRVPE